MSERLKVRSIAELEQDWSWDDVVVMHDILDELDRADVEAHNRAKESARYG